MKAGAAAAAPDVVLRCKRQPVGARVSSASVGCPTKGSGIILPIRKAVTRSPSERVSAAVGCGSSITLPSYSLRLRLSLLFKFFSQSRDYPLLKS